MRIKYHKNFSRELANKPIKIQNKYFEREKLWHENPRHPLLDDHALNPPYRGCRSFNVTGDYRVIYEIVGDAATLLRIGTHSELYS